MSINEEERKPDDLLSEIDFRKAKLNRFRDNRESIDSNRFLNLLTQWGRSYIDQFSATKLVLSLPSSFHTDEGDGFLRAIDSGILRVSDIGGCSLPFVHRVKKPTEPTSLFGIKNQSSVYLAWREYVTQVGALTSLVLDYEWPQELVALDPGDTTFDVACYSSRSRTAEMLVSGETKKTERELWATRRKLVEASKLGLTLQVLPPKVEKQAYNRLPDGQKKYIGLLVEKPSFFWMVAPGIRWAFRVDYEANVAIIEEIDDLPAFSDIINLKGLKGV